MRCNLDTKALRHSFTSNSKSLNKLPDHEEIFYYRLQRSTFLRFPLDSEVRDSRRSPEGRHPRQHAAIIIFI